MKHSSKVLNACKLMREELRKTHHSKKECETIPSQLSNWSIILSRIDSVYDEDCSCSFTKQDFEKAMEIFPKFQSNVSRYLNYVGNKKECAEICQVLKEFVSEKQSLLELNKQHFLSIEREAMGVEIDYTYCMCKDDF